MKTYAKTLGKSILLVVVCAVAGLLLLLAAFSLPSGRTQENMATSAAIFAKEGAYPQVNTLGANSQLDNFTDALMLMNAAYVEDTSLLDRVINVYRPVVNGENPAQVFVSCYGEGEPADDVSAYPRYWHGYLVTLKPLLMLFEYGQIRVINAMVVAALALGVAVMMYRRGLGRYVLAYLIALMMIDPVAISHSLQFMTVYCLYSLAAIVFLWKREKLLASETRLLIFFTLTGCLTSYFDFLTYPLVTYGVPATLYLCSVPDATWKKALKGLVLTLVAWGVGYVGMWTGKWILGSLLGGGNLLEEALRLLRIRTSNSDAAGAQASLFMLVKRQLFRLKSPSLAVAAVYVLVTGVCFLKRAPRRKLAGLSWLPWIALCVLPFVWYVGAFNHSYVHAFFTYRELMITAFCGMCLLTRYAQKVENPTPLKA